MTVPAAVLPVRTLTQRPVFEALTKKLPVIASGVMFQACDAWPLQVARVTAVELVAAPASRHLVGWLIGEMVQFDGSPVLWRMSLMKPPRGHSRALNNPAFHYAHSLRKGDLIVWDNCAVHHLAVFDYGDIPRRLHRAGLLGPVPV